MSQEQLAALLAKLKDDVGLQEKLKWAADLDAVMAIARETGFELCKADWVKYQAPQTMGLSDEEVEGVAGGTNATVANAFSGCDTCSPNGWANACS